MTKPDYGQEAAEAFHTAPKTALPDNPTGLTPVEDKCLIRLDPTEEKVGSILMPPKNQDRSQQAQTFATLIRIGGSCFEGWSGIVPKPGDRVVIEKYAGTPPKAGDIEDLYRFCFDKEIVAVMQK